MVVDRSRVALEDSEVADSGPRQRETACQSGPADAVLELGQMPLQFVQVGNLLLHIDLGLCLLDQIVDLGIAGAFIAAFACEDRSAGRPRLGPVAPHVVVDWVG